MKAFAEMLVRLAPFLLWVATVVASQVSIHWDLNEDDDDNDVHDKDADKHDVHGKDDDDGDDNDVQMMLMVQGLTAKQWSEKGTVGHFGGVVLSPSYRHVRLYLKHIHIYFNTRCVKMGECFSQTKI